MSRAILKRFDHERVPADWPRCVCILSNRLLFGTYSSRSSCSPGQTQINLDISLLKLA